MVKEKYFKHKCECRNCGKEWLESIEFGGEIRSTDLSGWAYYRIKVLIDNGLYPRDFRIKCKVCGSNKIRWRYY